ncbi:protein TESPA1 isoform X1 [Periophthalmus magnuspinnatus]|uniref:protein TESPA1 isoform X1 n=1 Tax=Periophthalmus magnuspinnatus TaxID=409849 RepID=UPI002436D3F6|nr:protein TESPA1 isoform X1 [Periophthalmus magnuspinnatus]
MESPASTVRRRAWINSCRQQFTDPLLSSLQSTTIADDDVFCDGQVNSPGCSTGKIEKWLFCCRSGSSENAGHLSFDSALKAESFNDELNLGADADTVYDTHDTGKLELRLPSKNPGHSLGSSFNSSSTWNSTTSVAEVLQLYSEKAEETLYELGFGSEDPQVTVRIPPRFFTFPSQAKGINFRLFLDAQIQRIREEDPSLSLASRFRQVQVLTTMANVFYSLYSHVSRTPVQKLPTPEFNFSTPIERMERFRSSIRSDPRSPVDKLKDTVSKMCLYSGSNREYDSPLPSPNKRVSLPDIVDIVLEKPGHMRKTEMGKNRVNEQLDVCMADQDMNTVHIQQERQKTNGGHTAEERANQNGTANNDHVISDQAHICQSEDFTSLLSEAVDPGSTVWANPKSLVKDEHICPQIVERIHQAPFYHQCRDFKKTD